MGSPRTVLACACAFWLCGCVATASMAVKTLTTKASAARHAPASATARAEYVGAAVGAGLVAAAGFYLPCSFLPLARKEAIRIAALGPRARPWHFFHPWKLLALCICIPSAVAVAQYGLHADSTFVGCLVYGGNVVPVSLGLGGGAGVLAHAWWRAGRDHGADGGARLLEEGGSGGGGGEGAAGGGGELLATPVDDGETFVA